MSTSEFRFSFLLQNFFLEKMIVFGNFFDSVHRFSRPNENIVIDFTKNFEKNFTMKVTKISFRHFVTCFDSLFSLRKFFLCEVDDEFRIVRKKFRSMHEHFFSVKSNFFFRMILKILSVRHHFHRLRTKMSIFSSKIRIFSVTKNFSRIREFHNRRFSTDFSFANFLSNVDFHVHTNGEVR